MNYNSDMIDTRTTSMANCLKHLLLVIIVFVMYEIVSLDGIIGLLGPILFGDTTIYSDRWNYWRYRSVKRGMTVDEVTQLLGEPLNKTDNEFWPDGPDFIFHYSRSSCDSHYRERSIGFKNGRVVKKYSEFYVD